MGLILNNITKLPLVSSNITLDFGLTTSLPLITLFNDNASVEATAKF